MRVHGLSNVAIEALLADGPRLARATRTDPQQERVWLIDNATGARMGDVVVGRRDSVSATPLLVALDRHTGCVAIFAHTHPDDVPFSDQDVAVYLRHPGVLAIVVVTIRSWYVISTDSAARPLSAVYEEEYARIGEELQDDVRRIGKPAAFRKHGHALWEAAAPRLQLRYQRIEGGTAGDDA